MKLTKAILKCYSHIPTDEFNMWKLINYVRRETHRNFFDETIKRELRYLRQIGKLDYEVLDKINGIYKFKEIGELK